MPVVRRVVACAFAAALLCAAPPASAAAEVQGPGPPPWSFQFTNWEGPPIDVAYYIPRKAHANSPVLIVVPGASRDVQRFQASWLHHAHKFGFAVVTLGAEQPRFPDEYAYNAGGVRNAEGALQPPAQWLFGAVDKVFAEFKARFGFTAPRYYLFGHSAGGGFVHRLLLFQPQAKVARAVAANPAFVTLPNWDAPYPFALGELHAPNAPPALAPFAAANSPAAQARLGEWFAAPLTILLGSEDLKPRTKALSNGPLARAQGPHVFARGKLLFARARAEARRRKLPFNWELVVAKGVGHNNRKIAPYALKVLFNPQAPAADKGE